MNLYPMELQAGDKIIRTNPGLQAKIEKNGEKYWGFLRRILDRGSIEIDYDDLRISNKIRARGRYSCCMVPLE